MKFILICINYNSYKYLVKCLESIDRACGLSGAEKMDVEVLVGDASSEYEPVDFVPSNFNLSVYKIGNLGYFGGARKVMDIYGMERIKEADYVAVANVDLEIEGDFFGKLARLKVPEDTGWICPRIYNPVLGIDYNPMHNQRYTRSEIRILRFLYANPFIFSGYKMTLGKWKQKKKTGAVANTDIKYVYCGRGAFFIFTKKGADALLPWDFPCFLYGEELYCAEVLRNNSLKTLYVPDLEIKIVEHHVSTSKLGRKRFKELNIEALDKMSALFWKESN